MSKELFSPAFISGIGKSTLIETLFNSSFGASPGDHEAEGVRLKSSTHRLKESNVDLKLTIVDSVGFGDQVNKDQSWTPIVEYIDAKFEDYLQVIDCLRDSWLNVEGHLEFCWTRFFLFHIWEKNPYVGKKKIHISRR